jgi:hypothetical protein
MSFIDKNTLFLFILDFIIWFPTFLFISFNLITFKCFWSYMYENVSVPFPTVDLIENT